MVTGDDGVAPRPAIGGEQAVGGGEGGVQARPLVDLGIVRQAGIGLGHGGGQLGVAAVGTMGPEQGVVVGQGFAVDECLGNVAA